MSKKTLLIGWDAADWEVINPLMEAGKMPALQHLVENGVSGNLSTLEPVFSPMLWSSIATGKYADKHGVLGFIEQDFNLGGVRPVGGASRKTSAIWDILGHEGFKTNVVGWWPSHPAEAINGAMVSNFFQKAPANFNGSWKTPPGSVYPPKLAQTLGSLRVHPMELTEQHLLPFVPDAAKIDQEKDKRLISIAKILSEASNIQSSATWLMENTEWDFMAVYFDNIDHFCHGFMKYHPPKMKFIDEKAFKMYSKVIESAYIFHDMMLGRMLDIIDKETTVVLVSDHGFESGKNRLNSLPNEAAAPAYDHRSLGVFVAMGPQIKKDELLYGASLLDITPTLLSIYDLPIGTDMDGKPLLNIFRKEKEIKYIDSWDAFIKRKTDDTQDKAAAEEALRMLVELGYVEKPDDDAEKAFKKTARETKFNLARVYLSSNRPTEGITILEELFNKDPVSKYGLRLILGYEALEKYEEAYLVIEKLEGQIKNPIQQLTTLKISILFKLKKTKAAKKILTEAIQRKAHTPFVAQRFAKALLSLKENDKANNYLERVLKDFPENSSLLYLKGMAFYNARNFKTAIGYFIDSIGNQFLNPKAHFYLGESFMEIGLLEDAYRAFSISMQQKSNIKVSFQRLAELEKKGIKLDLNEAELVQYHAKNSPKIKVDEGIQQQFLDQLEGTVYIVSGLPRSGTSMMMQMLAAGGADLFTDNKREADKSNPKGYLEHAGIKNLAKNKKLIVEAEGKIVKVVAPQLKYLPPWYNYKVIFMKRDINEVIVSQNKMSGNGEKNFPYQLKQHYENLLKEVIEDCLSKVHFDHIEVNYEDALNRPEEVAQKVSSFLNELSLDGFKMTSAIDKKLYRNRKELLT